MTNEENALLIDLAASVAAPMFERIRRIILDRDERDVRHTREVQALNQQIDDVRRELEARQKDYSDATAELFRAKDALRRAGDQLRDRINHLETERRELVSIAFSLATALQRLDQRP